MPTTPERDRRRYADSTIIAAQHRVLEMAASYLEQLPQRLLDTAVVDRGTGITTGDDVLHHIREALKLKRRSPR